MEYLDLYNYLRDQEELTRVQAIRSIMDIRNLNIDIRAAIGKWVKTGQCDLSVADVSFNELVSEVKMKPIRAFKMLDWLKREPVLAHRYLAQRVMRADLSKCGSARTANDIDDSNQSDIVL